MSNLSSLKGLGPVSQRQLNAIGITTREDLERIGPVKAYMELQAKGFNPSLNFLFAMAGALQTKDWRVVAKEDRTRLLLELEDVQNAEF